MIEYMNTTISVPNHQNIAPPLRRLAPAKWDALIARSRHLLPEFSQRVVAEVLEGHASDSLFHVERLGKLLEILVRAYAIGVFSSCEIESDARKRQNWGEEAGPSRGELQLVRCAHRGLLTHCLARVYILARKSITPPAIEIISIPELWNERRESEARVDDWQQALTEANNRVEWACLSDVVVHG
jgi:hypothetical protein